MSCLSVDSGFGMGLSYMVLPEAFTRLFTASRASPGACGSTEGREQNAMPTNGRPARDRTGTIGSRSDRTPRRGPVWPDFGRII